jgi:hypothetical protein
VTGSPTLLNHRPSDNLGPASKMFGTIISVNMLPDSYAGARSPEDIHFIDWVSVTSLSMWLQFTP